MARGGHGLPKVSLEPAMLYPSTPCKRPPLKRPYSHFRDGRPLDTPCCIPFVIFNVTPLKLVGHLKGKLSSEEKKSEKFIYDKVKKYKVACKISA